MSFVSNKTNTTTSFRNIIERVISEEREKKSELNKGGSDWSE